MVLNVVIIFIDDMGYNDVGYYGSIVFILMIDWLVF